MASVRQVLKELQAVADPARRPGMASVGINVERALGVSVPNLRKLAKRFGPDHELASALCATGIQEARLLATMVDDPANVTPDQMESWVVGVDSWDVCDHMCGNLLDKTPFAAAKAREWSERPEEFVKRAAFSLMAELAVHDKAAGDRVFERFLPLIRRGATDERSAVKKSVSWSLRQIGKRDAHLNTKAIATAERLRTMDSRSARWIGADALRELRSDAVQQRQSTTASGRGAPRPVLGAGAGTDRRPAAR